MAHRLIVIKEAECLHDLLAGVALTHLSCGNGQEEEKRVSVGAGAITLYRPKSYNDQPEDLLP
jgi:hypothetical protein